MAGTPEQVPSLARFRRQYPTEAACRSLLEQFRWPQGPFCPHCGSFAHWDLFGPSCRPGLKECRDCRRQYTVTTKTPLHGKHPREAARLSRARVAASGYDGVWLRRPQRLQTFR